MNKKQKQKRILLAAALAAALVVLLIFALAMNCAGKEARETTTAQQTSPVVISEILVSNRQAVRDPMGTYSDYVELLNTSSAAVNLTGYGLSDSETGAWIFPDGTILQPGQYYVVWCAGMDTGISNVTDFALSKDDVLRLIDASGVPAVTVSLADTYAGLSYCYDAQTGTWDNKAPSPGYPNTEAGIAAYEQSKMISQEIGTVETVASSAVRISEFQASNSSAHLGPDGTYCDWIELYNNSSSAVNLSGYGLSDDIAKPKKFLFENVTIEPYGFLVVYNTVQPTEGAICIDFGLSSRGETLLLTSPEDKIIDLIEFGAQEKNYSMARAFPNGAFDPNSAFTPTEKITPGYPNTESGYTLFDKAENGEMGVHDIMFSEVLVNGYHIVYQYSSSTKGDRPFDADYGAWIEIYNGADTAIDLSGYSVSNNLARPTKWVFPDGTSIAAKGYLALQLKGSLPRDGETKATEQQLRYQLNFDISSEGETIYLYNPAGTMIDRVAVPKCRACVSYGRDASGEWVLFDTPTEAAQNPAKGYGIYCEAAEADTPSGVYDAVQTVNIRVPEGCYATYTTDATTPTTESTRVSGPIPVTQNTVLRVRTFSQKGTSYPSDTKSYTYIIVGETETVEAHHTTLPVCFLVTDPDNLWDTTTGIYVKGNDYTGKGAVKDPNEIYIQDSETMGTWANFNMRGKMWERPATFTWCDVDAQNILYEGDLNIRIFGAFSRKKAQKGIALIGRKGVGSSWIEYPFFDNRPFDRYKSLVLRASAQDCALSRIRDVLVCGLLNDGNIDMANQAYVQCIVYLNGEYWGVYNLREKISKFFFAQHFGIEDTDSIDILVGNGKATGNVVADVNGDALKDYQDLIAFCQSKNCDLSNDADYQYVCDRVDVRNFAQYCAFEIIVGNTDTGNIKWWRSTELDNKWRWVAYDFCWAFNREDPNSDITKTSGYRRDFFSKYFNPAGHGAGNGFDTTLGRSLLSNNQFVEIFLYYCADFFNNVYSPEKINAKVTELQENIRYEMENYDLTRWQPYIHLSVKGWNSHVNNIRNYANNYQDYFLKYCQNFINNNTHYKLTDEKMIQLFGRVSNL
ncbi:MAG: lamin tail domain-containing protein [Clostridia bacterium]|nr:lamin tail domain-containing protein [Clostridia bacterium]